MTEEYEYTILAAGLLVELVLTGERVFVKSHTCEADGEKLYSVGMSDAFQIHLWSHGHKREELTVVPPREETKT